jgi:carboxynorspermidine decarboxylase
LRINPEHSEVPHVLYDPAAPGSRLGIRAADMPKLLPGGIDGLHFHTLRESGADSLERTLASVEKRFTTQLAQIEWVNFGAGHHITRPGYDVERLIQTVLRFQQRWQVQVYLEPGEAIALNTGYLVTQVLDIVAGDPPTAILETSATAHMPDVLEMPYRPRLADAGNLGELAHSYRLGGLTCLAGDVLGDYSFNEPLVPGRKLVSSTWRTTPWLKIRCLTVFACRP